MTLNGHFTLNSFFQVQNLLIYLYRQRRSDIYDEGIDNIFGEGHMYTYRKLQSY